METIGLVITLLMFVVLPLCWLTLSYITYYKEKRRRQQKLDELKDDLNKLRNNINEIKMVLERKREKLQKRKEEKK